ncbi:hypothetical protein D9757_001880 [Collybiopsis confluens]|uniref:Uncharacterized protein n=1 Tax=Collybiopsis confluens TaxID=2823264 RepID=A0A8H5HXW4_9AGAR|nr:hypothetical protein D9757_001880 [Collybiopsis confluens]
MFPSTIDSYVWALISSLELQLILDESALSLQNSFRQFYNSRGELRKTPNGYGAPPHPAKCRYIHPDDPEWNRLPPARRPAYLAKTPPPPEYRKPASERIDITPGSDYTSAPLSSSAELPPSSTTNAPHAPTPAKLSEESLLELIELRANYDILLDEQKALDEALRISSSSGPRAIVSRLEARKQEVQKQSNTVRLRLRDWERRLDSGYVSDPALDSQLALLRNLLSEMSSKMIEADNLQKRLASSSSTSAQEKQEEIDEDGDVVMDKPGDSSSGKRKNLDLEAAVPAEKRLSYLQETIRKVIHHVTAVEHDVNIEEKKVKEIVMTSIKAASLNQKRKSDDVSDSFDDQLSEIDEYIKEVSAENARLNATRNGLMEKSVKQKDELAKLADRLDKLQKERQEDDLQIKLLSDTLKSFLERPLSPSTSPFQPEDVAADVEERLTPSIKDALRPHLENLRLELAAEVQKHDLETYNAIAPKIRMTQNAISNISKMSS